jgi:hypothetical protein
MQRICRFARLIAVVMMVCGAAAWGRSPETLTPLPDGTTLPVLLQQGLDMRQVRAGQPLIARLAQRVPLGRGVYLPQKAEVIGTIVACDSASLTLRFDRLRLGKQEEPIDVKLQAAAHWLDVHNSELPEDATDRSTGHPASWTTKQIGGDEVYRMAGSGRSMTSTASLWGMPIFTVCTNRQQRLANHPVRWGRFRRPRLACMTCRGLRLHRPAAREGRSCFA